METLPWTDVVTALAAVATPLIVAMIGFLLSRRLKTVEAAQQRNHELIKTRLEYYLRIAPQLNDLMCYMTFIGSWKEMTPPDAVKLKRALDRDFHVAAPLFNSPSHTAYEEFMGLCYSTFNKWGHDALIRTGYGRRRAAFAGDWKPEWSRFFELGEDEHISREALEEIRRAYDAVLVRLISDLELTSARSDYTRARVVWNAH